MVDQRYYGYPIQQYQQRSYDLVKVNGKNGAAAFSMPPNSSVLLLDTTAPVIWLKTTDGASYPTITGYSITELKEEPEVPISDFHELVERIEKLEELLNGKSDTTSNKSRKQPNAAVQ